MVRSRVAVLKTTPATLIDDCKRLMRLAGYQQFLPHDKETALKINISSNGSVATLRDRQRLG